MLVNSISCTQPANNIQKKNRIQNKNNNKFISFKAGLTTLKEKSDIFIPKVTDYIVNAKKITFDGLNTILHTVVGYNAVIKNFTKSQKKVFINSAATTTQKWNEYTSKIEHSIFLNLPKYNSISPLLTLFPNSNLYKTNQFNRARFLECTVHEATHVFQDNSSDRLSTFDFYKKYFKKDIPDEIKKDTLLASIKVFSVVQESMIPIFRIINDYVKNKSDMVNIDVLDKIFQEHFKNSSASIANYINFAINFALNICKNEYPNCDLAQLMNTIHYSLQCEIEAYTAGLNAKNNVYNIGIDANDYPAKIYSYVAQLIEDKSISLDDKFIQSKDLFINK